jgi:hypothetical protein
MSQKENQENFNWLGKKDLLRFNEIINAIACSQNK